MCIEYSSNNSNHTLDLAEQIILVLCAIHTQSRFDTDKMHVISKHSDRMFFNVLDKFTIQKRLNGLNEFRLHM